MNPIRALMCAALCVAASGVAEAHHSFVGTYDDKAPPVTIKGEIVQFLFRNPHSFIHVLAPDDKGEMQRWAIEWGGGGQIQRMGITREKRCGPATSSSSPACPAASERITGC